MLYIMFAIGSDRYALDSSHVVEIVPRVELWQVPKPRRRRGVSLSRAARAGA